MGTIEEYWGKFVKLLEANPQLQLFTAMAAIFLVFLFFYVLIANRKYRKIKKSFSGIDEKSVDNYLVKLAGNAETGRQIIEGLDEQIGQRKKDNLHLENEKDRLEKEIKDLKNNPDSFADKIYQSHRKEITTISKKLKGRANWRVFWALFFGGLFGAAGAAFFVIYWAGTHPGFLETTLKTLHLK